MGDEDKGRDFWIHVGNASNDIILEIDNQLEKWGLQRHCTVGWSAILLEELCESVSEIETICITPLTGIVNDRLGGTAEEDVKRIVDKEMANITHTNLSEIGSDAWREEMIQVAAVAIAAIASQDLIKEERDQNRSS